MFFEEAARCHKGKLAMDFFAWAQKQFACGGSSFAKVQDGYDFGLLRVGLIWQLWIAFYGPRLPILQAETYSSSALGSPDSIHFRQISELGANTIWSTERRLDGDTTWAKLATLRNTAFS